MWGFIIKAAKFIGNNWHWMLAVLLIFVGLLLRYRIARATEEVKQAAWSLRKPGAFVGFLITLLVLVVIVVGIVVWYKKL